MAHNFDTPQYNLQNSTQLLNYILYYIQIINYLFQIVLHNPVETPKMSAFGTVLAPGRETRMIITPHIITAADELRKISQEKRQCLFNNERSLRFYRTYTQRNCALECEANFTLEFCKCVLYYMPSKP